MRQTGLDRAIGDPFLEDFFSRVPRATADSFTDEQLMAVKLAFGARHRGAHAIDIRLSFPLPINRFYVVLLAGSERRAPARRRNDRMASPLATLGNAVFAVFFFGMLVAALLGLLYVVKSALGVDLFPGFSLGIWDGLREQFRFLVR